jgi:hypothetical protein
MYDLILAGVWYKKDMAKSFYEIFDPIQLQVERVFTENSSSHPEYVSRAFRYPIRMPILFRKSGTADWHEGTTVNFSRTGILFQSNMDFPPRTLLEMQIALPQEVAGEAQANVLCWGPVVRSDEKVAEPGRIALAAVIARYRFGHN